MIDDRSRTLAGIGFAALGSALFVTMDAVVKILAADYSVVQILFAVQVAALPILLVLALRSGGRRAFAVRRPTLQLMRATLFCLTGIGFFMAFRSMPMADVYTISFAAPLTITALSAVLLREPVGWARWIAIAVGFTGVLVMLRPGSGMFQPAALWGLFGMLCLSFNMVLIRRLGATDGPVAMMGYNIAVTAALAGLALPFGFFRLPDIEGLGLMLLAGLINGCAMVAQIQGFRLAPPAAAAPFQYTQLLWGVLYGFLLFDDRPEPGMLTGAAIVVASGLYVLLGESRRRAVRG